ncbi:Transposable element Tcb1 transposase Transposable element Barney transposase [Larimichthys crocea]|uniref:Transposable element Tcb1 transposase Transposable element Barney transposase n=1 Tax=Larimichthys crocea TaxID=215358 RepID=A0A6G0IIP9_LARCR|nr:Transposable element Tcb1 transposase Transposable element Barney transposase [Larimichthys crocea]
MRLFWVGVRGASDNGVSAGLALSPPELLSLCADMKVRAALFSGHPGHPSAAPALPRLCSAAAGSQKIDNTLKLSRSTVAKTIQRFNRTGSTHGQPKKMSACVQCPIQRLSLENRRMNASSIAAEVEEVGGQPVSAQTIHRTLHQIGLHGCGPRRKPLLMMMHKKARKQFAEDKQTKDMDYWNHVPWSDETRINLFGSDGVKHVWQQPGEEYKDKCVLPTIKHGGGSVMVWGCMSADGSGELQFIEGTMNANMSS